MFLPLRDENPTVRTPVVTYALVLLNVAAFIYQLRHGIFETSYDYGLLPAWFLHGQRDGQLQLTGVNGALVPAHLHQEVPYPLTIITSMFMHGGWLHTIFNMWFLWIFGDNVEDSMGSLKFALFYFLCGIIAALTYVFYAPTSSVPMLGASGAIAGVLGAYALLYPRAKVRVLLTIIIVNVPAWIVLGVWFGSQFFVPGESGVAWMAHVGGFIGGCALVFLFARRAFLRGIKVNWSGG